MNMTINRVGILECKTKPFYIIQNGTRVKVKLGRIQGIFTLAWVSNHLESGRGGGEGEGNGKNGNKRPCTLAISWLFTHFTALSTE